MKVWLTGFADTNRKCIDFLNSKKAEIIDLPLQEMAVLPGVIKPLGKQDWVIFTSPSAVRLFMQHLYPLIPFDKAACVGPSTKEALEDNYGRACSLMPKQDYSAKGLVEAIKEKIHLFKDQKILFPCSAKAAHTIGDSLPTLKVKRYDFYDVVAKDMDLIKDCDAVAFFSSSAVEALYHLKGSSFLIGKKVAVIGGATAQTFEQFFGNDYTKAKKSTALATVEALF